VLFAGGVVLLCICRAFILIIFDFLCDVLQELALKRKALFAKIPKGMCEILPGKLWLGSGRYACLSICFVCGKSSNNTI
jgi:hypothetical protein